MLNSQVTKWGERTCATHAFTVNGQQWEVFGALDKDKQPMSLIGTGGTTKNQKNTCLKLYSETIAMAIDRQGQCIWNSGIFMRSIAQTSRNAINKHDGKKQGFTSFEETWKAHSW